MDHHFGEGGKVNDPQLTHEKYKLTAQSGVLSAQYKLGDMLFERDGITKNYFETIIWFSRATEAGELRSMHRLAKIMFNADNGPDFLEVSENAADIALYERVAMLGRALSICSGLYQVLRGQLGGR